MPSTISNSLKNFFFPERSVYNYSGRETPVEGLTLAHELVLRLANQIEVHAADAPYPHIRRKLHEIAIQKLDSAIKVRTVIEKLGEKPRLPKGEPKTGKNHWERLTWTCRIRLPWMIYYSRSN